VIPKKKRTRRKKKTTHENLGSPPGSIDEGHDADARDDLLQRGGAARADVSNQQIPASFDLSCLNHERAAMLATILN